MASMGVVNSGYPVNVVRGINETSRMTLIRRIASNKPATAVDMPGDFYVTWQATSIHRSEILFPPPRLFLVSGF